MYNSLKIKLINSFFQHRLTPLQTGLKILTYHGIVENITETKLQRNFHSIKTFKAHLNLLKNKGFKALYSNQLDEALNTPNLKKVVWITFDDGYKNNKLAMEILDDFKMPATFFVSTATIGSEISIWTVNISLLLLKGHTNSLELNKKTYQLDTPEKRLNTFQEIRRELKNKNAVQRISCCNEIIKQFPKNELDRLIHLHPYFRMFNWNELEALHNSGIDFQSHGHNHELHHEEQTEDIIREEVVKSKQLFKQKLNKDITLFAYPNGNAENKYSEKILKDAGYKHAFILEKNYKSYPFKINRIDPNSKPEKLLRDLYLK